MKLPIPSPQICPPRPPGQTNFPHLSIQSALEMEIPAHLIARRINEMIEATRETSFGSVQSDWATVEAGLRLYLEFTKRPMFPGISLPETTSGFPADPIAAELQGRPNRQKQPLSRQNEDADTLKNFMTSSQAAVFMDEASVWEKEGSEFAVHWRQRSQPAPDLAERCEPEVVNRSAPWLSVLSAITIAGLALSVGFLFPKADTTQSETPATFQLAKTSMGSLPESGHPLEKADSPLDLEPPPAGWASRKDYDEWKPKFEVSLLPE